MSAEMAQVQRMAPVCPPRRNWQYRIGGCEGGSRQCHVLSEQSKATFHRQIDLNTGGINPRPYHFPHLFRSHV